MAVVLSQIEERCSPQHLTSYISIRTTEYVIEQILAVNSVAVVLSQIEEWCSPLHFTYDLLLGHSGARCLVPVQLKHNFFLREYQLAFFNITYWFAVTGFMPRFLTLNTVAVIIILSFVLDACLRLKPSQRSELFSNFW